MDVAVGGGRHFSIVIAAALCLLVTGAPILIAASQEGAGVSGNDGLTSLGGDLSVQQLLPGVWRHVSVQEVPGYGPVPANGLLVVGEGLSSVIDTPWTDDQSARLMEWAERTLQAPVGLVIVTHAHEDCLGGLGEFHRRGVQSYGLDRTIALAQERRLEVPETGFTDRLETDAGGLRLELLYPGPGHSADNIVVWLPEAQVLFGGCLVKSASSQNMGNTQEADLQAWKTSIEKVIGAFPEAKMVVPGHGSSGGMELLNHTVELIDALKTGP